MQNTIGNPFSVEGIGLHTGKPAKLIVKPSTPGSGIVFENAGHLVPAIVENVNNTTYGVTLKSNQKEVKTCEHILSALYGMGIDNAICEVESDEIPALDGSSIGFTRLIKDNGVEHQSIPRKLIEIKEPIFLSKGDACIFAIPDAELRVSFIIDYPHPGIDTQYNSFTLTPDVYFNEIADARTYTFIDWIDELREMGLIKGGSLRNAIVIDKDGPMLASGSLRFRDEFVRHKILDMIGDLALLGARLKGWIFGVKAGHNLNIEFVRRLKCSLI